MRIKEELGFQESDERLLNSSENRRRRKRNGFLFPTEFRFPFAFLSCEVVAFLCPMW